jgi:hypothetical protein
MPYGITYKEIDLLSERLATKLDIPDDKVKLAFKDIVREDVLKIARNEIEG